MQKFVKPLAACLKQQTRLYRVENPVVKNFFKNIIEMHPSRAEQQPENLIYEELMFFSPDEQRDLLYLANSIHNTHITDSFDLTDFFSDKEEHLLTNLKEFSHTCNGHLSNCQGIVNFALVQNLPLLVMRTSDEKRPYAFQTLEHHFSNNIKKSIEKYIENKNYMQEPGFEKSIVCTQDKKTSLYINNDCYHLYDHSIQKLIPFFGTDSAYLKAYKYSQKASFSLNNHYVAFQTEYNTIRVYSVPRWKVINSILERHTQKKHSREGIDL